MSRLKDLRKKRGYTQLNMQMKTGINQSDFSKSRAESATTPLNNANELHWP